MQDFQKQFIDLAVAHKVLCFGSFSLKSGRVSPYFFNAGRFTTAKALAQLGRCYAAAIVDSGVPFDLLFGPAYKGIPLAAVTASALADQYNQDCFYAFNRKEQKGHGEGGLLVGAPLQGRVLIVDDVITAGTAVREVIELVTAAGAEVAGVVIGLDRQEKGQGELSAIQELEQAYSFPVISLIQLQQVMKYLEQKGEAALLANMQTYRQQYGI